MDSTLACLAAWMPRQRWYAAKGRLPSLRLVSWFDLPSPDPLATLRTYLVVDEGALPAVLYQLPVVARSTETVDADPSHVIGSPDPGTTFIDAPHDPAYTEALLRVILDGGTASGPRTEVHGRIATATRSTMSARPPASVLSGEQSNTSLIYPGDHPIIVKVFRQLHAGLNPDIELTTALSRAQSPHVPASVGWLDGSWPDLDTAQGVVAGSLAFAQEFLPDVEDAWRVALRAAARSEDFRAEARELGTTTADVHLTLADILLTRDSTNADRQTTAATWARRLTIAIAEVPEVAQRRQAIESVYRAALERDWPRQQRVHGDYHLGQVLRDPRRGWVLLDFEGEPLRPMVERTRPDLALRDVAGMLRSFDYVAGSLRLDQPERSPEQMRDWAWAARTAFVDGYAARSGVDLDLDDPLLAALELDKAVYEAIYESRNRPTWVSIPLRAIERLAHGAAVA